MDQLSYGAIYILILTAIGSYYFVRFYLIKCGFFIIKWIFLISIIRPFQIPGDLFRYCKKKKRIAKYATPTQFIIKIVCEICLVIGCIILCLLMLIIYTIIIILVHLLVYWIFFIDHSSWIMWAQLGWAVWFFVRGVIIFPMLIIAWKHLRTFPKIKYFKDLRHMFFVSFSYIYLVVLLVTFGEVVRLASSGIITTPLYLYYVKWFHMIVGA